MLVFTEQFKQSAISKSEHGISAKQIFKDAGIDVNKYAPKYFQQLVKQWKRAKRKGNQSKRFKHKDINEMSLEELKARVAYLEVENDFLKKLKALEQGANIEDLL